MLCLLDKGKNHNWTFRLFLQRIHARTTKFDYKFASNLLFKIYLTTLIHDIIQIFWSPKDVQTWGDDPIYNEVQVVRCNPINDIGGEHTTLSPHPYNWSGTFTIFLRTGYRFLFNPP